MMTSSDWSTASFGEAPDSSPMELSALQDHVTVCKGQRGRWFTAQCRAEAFHGVLVSRFVTTVAVSVAAVGALVWLL